MNSPFHHINSVCGNTRHSAMSSIQPTDWLPFDQTMIRKLVADRKKDILLNPERSQISICPRMESWFVMTVPVKVFKNETPQLIVFH